MAFTYTRNNPDVFGNKRRISGTYASTAGSTGGAIVTGLSVIDSFNLTLSSPNAASTSISGGTATISTVANLTGIWEAIGY